MASSPEIICLDIWLPGVCVSVSLHKFSMGGGGLSACGRWELNASVVEQGINHPRLVVPEKMCPITHECQIRV